MVLTALLEPLEQTDKTVLMALLVPMDKTALRETKVTRVTKVIPAQMAWTELTEPLVQTVFPVRRETKVTRVTKVTLVKTVLLVLTDKTVPPELTVPLA